MALKKEVRHTSAVRERKTVTAKSDSVKRDSVKRDGLKSNSVKSAKTKSTTSKASLPKTYSSIPGVQRSCLPRNWETHCLQLATDGASEAELRAALGISRTKYDQLVKESAPFALIIERCRDLSLAWWERQGRENLQTKGFQTTLWNINMKQRYGWGEQQGDPTNAAEAIALRVAMFLDDLDTRVRPS